MQVCLEVPESLLSFVLGQPKVFCSPVAMTNTTPILVEKFYDIRVDCAHTQTLSIGF